MKRTIKILSSAHIVFYLMPALMILLIIGTLAQMPLGLYAAHQKFFASFMFFIGPVPLPGGYTLMGLLTVNLIIKFLFASEWSWKKTGIILTHLGTIILLLGGLVTSMTAKEGFLLLPEGSPPTPYIYDYNQRELYIFKGDELKRRIPFDDLNGTLETEIPLSIKVLSKCENCEIIRAEPNEKAQGMAQNMALKSINAEKDPEVNFSGATLEINENKYVAFEGMPFPIEIEDYKIIFGKQQRRLPFQVELINFLKTTYPGTNTAKAYHSDVMVHDGDINWPARVEMNKPLRYKGYTLYQSSFVRGDVESSIISVVKNKGMVFPYIGIFVITAGLLVHLVLVGKRKTL